VTDKEKTGRRNDVSGETEKMDLAAGKDADANLASNGPDKPRARQGMSPNLQAHIGRQLRAAFDEVAQEPVPERFLQLLKDLEKSGSSK
jgi:hypothetical protein